MNLENELIRMRIISEIFNFFCLIISAQGQRKDFILGHWVRGQENFSTNKTFKLNTITMYHNNRYNRYSKKI